MDRRCGGINNFVFAQGSKCVTYFASEEFPTAEDWLESFPHLYLTFEPAAVVTFYPRDYFSAQPDSKYCLAFDYLGGRIILGGIFFRNFDIQFDRSSSIVSFVRSECAPVEGFNFTKYYKDHTDRFTEFIRPKPESPLLRFSKRVILPVCLLLAAAICVWLLFVRRFKGRTALETAKVREEVEAADFKVETDQKQPEAAHEDSQEI